MSIFAALPVVKKTHMYSFDLPNKWNISFNYYYYLCFIIFSYLPGEDCPVIWRKKKQFV